MIKYYPLTQITPNLYTNGTDLVDSDSKAYVGRYYRTYDGRTFAGVNPVLGSNKELTQAVNNTTTGIGFNLPAPDSTYAAAATKSSYTSNVTTKTKLTNLTPYNPFPISSDYSKGYFTRYFAKSQSGPGYVIEISQEDWSLIQNGQTAANIVGYQTTSMFWQLTGPLHDTRLSQYQVVGGVYDTNKRVTENIAKNFIGLLSFIDGNYTKFAKITPSVATSGSK